MVDNSVLKEAGKLQMALRPAVELSYVAPAERKHRWMKRRIGVTP